MSRSPHFARDTISSLQIVLPNWYWDRASTKLEKGPGASATYTASIEYPAGTFTQIKFSGSVSGVALTATALVSDAVAVSIPTGALFWVRVWCSCTAGICFSASIVAAPESTSLLDSANGHVFAFNATAQADQTMGGTITQTGTSPFPAFCPTAIIGQTRKAAVFLMGDSIDWGANDIFDATGDLGASARSIGPTLAYINAGSYGDTAASAIQSTNYNLRGGLIQYCSHVICEYARNDLTAGSTAAAILTNLQTMWAKAGVKPVYQTTITPVSTSTDSYATTTNQTTATDNPQRTILNTSIRGVPSGTVGFFEIANQVENAQNTGIWKAPGFTNLGTHPTNAGYLTIKNSGAINPALFTR